MRFERRHAPKYLCMVGLLTIGLFACSQPTEEVAGTGGSNSSGGTKNTGGDSGGSGGSGGSVSSGGSKGSGGVSDTGGTKEGSGGSSEGGTKGSGGSESGGTSGTDTGKGGDKGSGGSSEGGTTGNGGRTGRNTGGARTGGTTGGGGTGEPDAGAGTGGSTGAGGRTGSGGNSGTGGGDGGSSGGCQKGQVKGNEVVIMGESFYAMSPQYIQKRIEDNARKAGVLGSNESYRNVAVSGQNMNYIATTEWTNASKSTTKFVIMDGGGIDCMSSSCSSCPDTFKTLLGKMSTAGVQDVIYTRYPEPGSPPGSNATLKKNLDTLMPKMEEVCKGTTSPKCYWVDLRPVWQNNDVMSDGLHPTQSGGDHVGDLIWQEMVKNCLAQ
jgi:hypothetical protein